MECKKLQPARLTKVEYTTGVAYVWMKTIRIFSDRIRDRIRLEGFRSVRIRVRIFNIRYCIRIRIFKSHIYDIDIQSYHIRHGWHYPYSNPNPTRNIKTNMISVISVRIRSVFIPGRTYGIFVCTSSKNFQALMHVRRARQAASPFLLSRTLVFSSWV
jgi:hypothetical protein